MCLSRKILYSLMLRIPIFFKLTSLDFPVDFTIFFHWNFHKHSLHCFSLTILENPPFFLNFQFLAYSLESTSLRLRLAIETPTTVVIWFSHQIILQVMRLFEQFNYPSFVISAASSALTIAKKDEPNIVSIMVFLYDFVIASH